MYDPKTGRFTDLESYLKGNPFYRQSLFAAIGQRIGILPDEKLELILADLDAYLQEKGVALPKVNRVT